MLLQIKHKKIMSPENTTEAQLKPSLVIRMLIGAGIGLLLISLLVLTVRQPDPAWGKLWMIRPLMVVSFAGAMGGLCDYFILQFRHLLGINKTVATILSVIVFVIGLWMGTILGLDGTLWN